MESQTIDVTEQWGHKQWWSQTTIRREQWRMYKKEGTMKFPVKWLCCTSNQSCELESCDHIST